MTAEKIYFDMDGVLADFDRGVRELCGMEAFDQGGRTPAEDDIMWDAIRKVDHFYDRLELMPGAKEMFDAVYGVYGDRCEILTGIPKPKRGIIGAGEDKVKVNICYRAEKILKCTGPETVLIDDLEKNILEWRAEDGTGILHRTAEETMKELKKLGIL